MSGPARIAATIVSAAALAVLAGCGLGPGKGTSDVNLTVTRNFGTQPVGSFTEKTVPGSETVMRMLERGFTVSTRYGGAFVESINGHAGDSSRHDWFYYVNGVEAGHGAAATAVNRGDRIWWDLHDWSATYTVPAVVGSFPEPFVHGIGGKRLPTTLECAPDEQAVCTKLGSVLRAFGVPTASALLGSGSGTDSLAVLVGTAAELRPTTAALLLARGPGSSGVYARFTADGRQLQLLDPAGRVAQMLGAGAGLVAATRDTVSEPAWFITGTNTTGVAAAAAAFTSAALHDHFALAVDSGRRLPVPVVGGA
jgi:Domain of unknown function (DUF4430)